MNLEKLEQLLSTRIAAVRSYPFGTNGSDRIELETTHGRCWAIRAVEVAHGAYETYRLDISELPPEEVVDGPFVLCDLPPFDVETITVCERDEWQQKDHLEYATVGSEPVMVHAGPVGSAPRGVSSLTIPCAIIINADRTGDVAVLIHVGDFPGMVEIATDMAEISAYRAQVSCEPVSRKRDDHVPCP